VKSLGGDVLSDSEVWHVYTIANGLIERMDLKESEANSAQTTICSIFQALTKNRGQTGHSPISTRRKIG
jgi:hypothetical protein